MSIYFCGGSCIEDVTTHLMNHLSLHPTLHTCSSDTILRAIKELTQENISYTSDTGKNYDFNTADTLNTLLLNCMFASDQLKEGEKMMRSMMQSLHTRSSLVIALAWRLLVT